MKIKRYIVLSFLASIVLMAGGEIQPVEPVTEATRVDAAGKISGQLRTFYIDRTYSGTFENNRNALAVGGWIGYDSALWNGLSFGTKVYSTSGFDIHSGARDIKSYDPSLYGDNFESYAFIGEAYLDYKINNTNLKIGRQKLDTPLVSADDARMLPNLFEAAVLSNTDIKDTTLILAHITRESVGTFGNAYSISYDPALPLQSGYGYGYKEATNGSFRDMAVVALGTGADTIGVSVASVVYKGISGLTFQAWDYYAHDILNAIYLQADYGWNCLLNDKIKMNASAQYINESDAGDKLAGEVDSNYWALKLGSSYGSLSGYVAYSQTGESDGWMNGGIITPWGGMPAFTQGMVTRHMFFSDTDTLKVAAIYSFKDAFGIDLKATGYFVSFDVGDTSTYAAGTTSEEAGFDIECNPENIKNLNLRLRANYPTDFSEGLNWAEYRVIANYNF